MTSAPRIGSHGVRRAVAAAVAGLSLIGLLSGCGYGKNAPDTAVSPAAAGTGKKLSSDTVKIGYFANLTHATVLVGLQEGLFAKELGGTRIRAQVFNAGPSEIEALNAGSIDIGWIGPSPAVNGWVKSGGKSLRIISGSASGGVKLVVNEKIKTVDDLEGKKIATPQLGNTQDVALLNYIAEQGWKVDAQTGKGDVSVVRLDNKETPNAFKTGQVDGAWVPEPTASKLVSEGGRVLIDERDLWPDRKFAITHVIVSQRFLEQHPDVVAAVLRGSVATNAWIKAHPDRAKANANAELSRLSGKGLPDDVLDAAWASLDFTDDPVASSLQTSADHAVKAGLLNQADLKGIYDLAPLNEILKSAGRPAVDAAGLGAG
ncbi:aliphatic sulfonate ABC transporter substrate-binding protein [Streptomyces sp. NPDC032472]|uniref:aliphatic sulfonate ABC transporter substrate-binding protein n=1 Tax=Streptomyces sp. NPDC032472 TaxID=3155018 RepID=UPI0033D9F184